MQKSTEDSWHCRFGQLGKRNLQRLTREKLVDGFDYDSSKGISFCKLCIEGKLHESQFPNTGGKRVKMPFELVHIKMRVGRFKHHHWMEAITFSHL